MMVKNINKIIKKEIDRYKSWQCPSCRSGNPCKHKEGDLVPDNNGNVHPVYIFLEDRKGKRKYFCQAACLFLSLPERTWGRLVDKCGGGVG